jgi:inorganic pyrophosphatase
MSVVEKLSPFDQDSGELNVIIETPRGCRNKYSYDEKRGVFKLSGVLPAGAVFPFDFGFIPRTVGDEAIHWTFLSLWTSRYLVDALCRRVY